MADSKPDIVMSGNEAIARGALESGIGFCASYPGTPSTEITTRLLEVVDEFDIHVEWSTNEKVALESAAAASWVGIPALCPMKSLGLNVASDFLLNLNLSGTGKGGLVIVVCDDPKGHSSSNEQDSRFYAKAAQIPLLEPSTFQEAKDVTRYAFELSQKYEVPVLLRSTTRLSHSRGLVRTEKITKREKKTREMPERLYNVPSPHLRHKDLIEKMNKVEEEFNDSPFNVGVNIKDGKLLILSSGISSLYTREAIHELEFEEIGRMNLVTTHPLPRKPVSQLLEKADGILFVEENDPFLEEAIRSFSVDMKGTPQFYGKMTGHIPSYGEMNTDVVINALKELTGQLVRDPRRVEHQSIDPVVERPLTFCAGCTHRNFYWAVRTVKKRLSGKLVVAGDIGCYSLGVFYDQAMDTMQAMGSGIGVGSGLGQLHKFGFDSKVISLAGDSTFFHACLPGLINAKHKSADLTFVILDNATTAMTGFQIHPGSSNQSGNLQRVDIEKIVKAIGPDFYAKGDATDIPSLIDLLHSTVQKEGLKILLLDSICWLEEVKRKPGFVGTTPVKIDERLCKGEKCKICVVDFGCSALSWDNEASLPSVLDQVCVQCGACIAVCPYKAIVESE
ncbi:MAG: indolepyruvate ferredoxin oxidoreductase [Candidatus Thorarchaeota archaeon]|nr:MAG: indolepyruvate ferredoxin oxidoreductase [Candidatus Thorarchaeota archaeon]